MKTEQKYNVQNREAGIVIDREVSLEQAERLLELYETCDKIEGLYVENFYEIVPCEN